MTLLWPTKRHPAPVHIYRGVHILLALCGARYPTLRVRLWRWQHTALCGSCLWQAASELGPVTLSNAWATIHADTERAYLYARVQVRGYGADMEADIPLTDSDDWSL